MKENYWIFVVQDIIRQSNMDSKVESASSEPIGDNICAKKKYIIPLPGGYTQYQIGSGGRITCPTRQDIC